MCQVTEAPARSIYVYHSIQQDLHSGISAAILSDKLLCKEQNASVDESSCIPAWVAITDGL